MKMYRIHILMTHIKVRKLRSATTILRLASAGVNLNTENKIGPDTGVFPRHLFKPLAIGRAESALSQDTRNYTFYDVSLIRFPFKLTCEKTRHFPKTFKCEFESSRGVSTPGNRIHNEVHFVGSRFFGFQHIYFSTNLKHSLIYAETPETLLGKRHLNQLFILSTRSLS